MRALLRSLSLAQKTRSKEHGQVIVIFAVFMITLMVLAGSAYDYASIVIEEAKLQNAVDSAALAGSNALVMNAGTPGTGQQYAAGTVTADYLRRNGIATQTPGTVVDIRFPTSTPVPGVTPVATMPVDNITIDVTRQHPTVFWPLIGINNVNFAQGGDAHAGRSMLDILLVFDTTPSMVDGSSPNSLEKARSAAVAFINAMNLTPGDSRGARIAMARFQGEIANIEWHEECEWVGTGHNRHEECEDVIDGTSYQDDYTLLTPGFTDDAAILRKLAIDDSTGSPQCLNTTYACPLKSIGMIPTTTYGSPTNVTRVSLGTKLPNAIRVAGTAANSIFSGPSGRNSPTTGIAKKVMVILTDGANMALRDLNLNDDWDTDVVNLANSLRPGPTNSPRRRY
jgi:Flp pilus assembly protein TadG